MKLYIDHIEETPELMQVYLTEVSHGIISGVENGLGWELQLDDGLEVSGDSADVDEEEMVG